MDLVGTTFRRNLSPLMMEALNSSQNSLLTRATWDNIPENGTLQIFRLYHITSFKLKKEAAGPYERSPMSSVCAFSCHEMGRIFIVTSLKFEDIKYRCILKHSVDIRPNRFPGILCAYR
jgi:hypothetical protein